MASMTIDQDSPEKVTYRRYVFLFLWSIEEDDTIMRKVAKAKAKPAANIKNKKKKQNKTKQKTKKAKTVLRSKTANRQTASKITI